MKTLQNLESEKKVMIAAPLLQPYLPYFEQYRLAFFFYSRILQSLWNFLHLPRKIDPKHFKLPNQLLVLSLEPLRLLSLLAKQLFFLLKAKEI